MTPYYQDDWVTIYHGDCRDVLEQLEEQSVHAAVTSPPYANQRQKQYGGIDEDSYPLWTLAWMTRLRPVLVDNGSVLINIREHINKGAMSDYVHWTRINLRHNDWHEIDELLWIKPDGPPVGRVDRPRRSWERILWFAPSNNPYCDPKAGAGPTDRIGLKGGRASAAWLHGSQNETMLSGRARWPDFTICSVRDRPAGIEHPAVYPVRVAKWLINLVTTSGAKVIDPFMGSGSTLVAARQLGRRSIGIDVSEDYCEVAARRCSQGVFDFEGAA